MAGSLPGKSSDIIFDMEKATSTEPMPAERVTDVDQGELASHGQQELHRGLKARHLSMIGKGEFQHNVHIY